MNIRNFIVGFFASTLIFVGALIGCDGDDDVTETPEVTEGDAGTTNNVEGANNASANNTTDTTSNSTDAGSSDAATTGDVTTDAGALEDM